ncbi:MAG: hypothetical protein ACM3O3_11390 [Syntrophothermus sp.]|nr:hypothetical protein [Ignavibacteriaceae bacterium]
MNRKVKSTLSLVALLIFILIAGGAYIFIFQAGKVKDKTAKLTELSKNDLDRNKLLLALDNAKEKIKKIDSILAARKFNIPQDISEIGFFTFMNNIAADFSGVTKINLEYMEKKPDKEFFFYEYKVTGSGDYNELYRMINSIEQSRELKKVKEASLTNQVEMDDDNVPRYLVNYSFLVDVYFSNNNRFSTTEFKENDLSSGILYDAFYPLIRLEVPPNIDNLLDVQGAKLLALIPEGAFLSDQKGDSYLLLEGDPVYLGYVTKIDYEKQNVSFIINKGGIIERINLQLEKEGLTKTTIK